MDAEQTIKHAIGELFVQSAALKAKIEELLTANAALQAELAKLKEQP